MTSFLRNKTVLLGTLICCVTLLAYQGILHNRFIGYDDLEYLIVNNHVSAGITWDGFLWALTATYDGNWFPLTWLSHMADMSLFGANPVGHHLVGLSLHICNTLLLFRILIRATGSVRRSAVVAALFALHPLHVESVVWAAERKDLLSTLFFMLTISAYLGYVSRRSVHRYLGVMALYACGLASKPMLVSLPLILLLLDFWPLRRMGSEQKPPLSLMVEKLPLMILSAASCILTFIVQKNGGAVNDLTRSSVGENIIHALVNYVGYLSKTFLPTDLAIIYPYVPTLSAWHLTGAVTLLLVITTLAIRKRRTHPYGIVGWSWFLITMLPVIGLVRVGAHSIADRYTYIPLIGIFIALVWTIAGQLGQSKRGDAVALLLVVLIVTPLSLLTARQTGYWRDSFTLFEHTLKVTDDNWLAHNNLAAEFMDHQQYRQALYHVRESLRINPEYSDAYLNLGKIYMCLGNATLAVQAYRDALAHNRSNPEACYKMALFYFESGNIQSALELQRIVERIDRTRGDALKKILDFKPAAH